MALFFLGLLLLAQSRGFFADDTGVIRSRLCGSDAIEFLKSTDGYLVYINRERVEDRALICGALDFCLANGDLLSDHEVSLFLHVICDDISVPFLQRLGRKLLLEFSTNASIPHQLARRGQLLEGKKNNNFSSVKDKLTLAIPGMFLLCCTLLCPCFRAKRKDPSEHHVLANELSQATSVPSNESTSVSRKVPGSPYRIPPSPGSERVPATPLRAPPSPSRFLLSPQLNRLGSVHLNTNQIIKATQNFSPSLRLGEGGFGTVYKALLPDGQVVAVKRAKKEHVSALRDEFSNEVELLAKIEHRNLVKLLGYNDKGNERIIITEYVPNGTLREHLDGQHGKILDFSQRLEIAIDVAHGLTYLHLYAEKTIIHRDIKASNILLTESYRAKVSDFGFARFGPAAEQTHIMTRVKGTAGYLDPEYLQTYQLTPKSDVFSYGILLLEILSARRPVDLKRDQDERILVRWAFNLYNAGDLRGLLDPLLEEEVDEDVLGKLFGLAFQCAAPTRAERPTMKQVGEQLWEIRKDYGRNRMRV
ncbi:hypothetical protein J5N97_007868 [Dioscorea zingiberensis]|uniref:non-specific serine/threonine protein kinase n=1 Tax=Dioscorea zingiberensis TaxID=325984 RepID=A0A9D5DHG9_9LILI|nr:hypothetical protein J5N97_007868 [Dioscorea zingiberensis]